MNLAEFLRVYPIRAQNLTWFLGAGATGRVPTATDLTWLFKRTVYCSEQKVSPRVLDDLSDESTRRRIQGYLDATNRFPPAGDPDEYAALFEFTYPDPRDRRAKLASLLGGAQPSFGHSALGALMKLGLARVIWTTNFDRVIEDAAHAAFGTSSRLTTADIDSAPTAIRALNESSFPLLVKLHGDFQSERLKNTRAELREQDAELRRAFVEGCRRFGLVVVGYSGRDHSIMDALQEAAQAPGSFPAGLFWAVRSSGEVFERVRELIERARAAGVDAHLVAVETFDEFLGDILTQLPDISDDLAQLRFNRTQRYSLAPNPDTRGTFPAIRLNALPIVELPTVCRLVECMIGNTDAVLEAVRTSGERVIASRKRVGVIGFGSDSAMRRVFDPYTITRFDVHQIDRKRLAFDSAELGLVAAALASALARGRGLCATRSRTGFRLTPESDADSSFQPIKRLLSISNSGTEVSLGLRPALAARLDVRFDRAWLLLEPAIDFDRGLAQDDVLRAKEYVRERLAKLYNRQFADVLDAWTDRLFGSEDELRVAALGIADGLDASFVISRMPAFTWRQQ